MSRSAAGLSGLLPVPEIQYLAYLHNAEDQLRGEAATLQFFSAGQYRNPLVVRVAGYGYQKGFGGHFHNDNAVGVLRDIPGLVIASPARPDDAAAMLRTCLAAAAVDGSVCVFLEPIALYHTRDLHDEGDGGWLAPYPEVYVPLGQARTYGDGGDLTMVTFGNGLRMCLRVARRLASQGIGARVVDLRWLAPLPAGDVLREARATGRVLVVDETRRSGGVSEGVVTALVDAGYQGRIARVTSEDSFIPLGPAAHSVLLDEPTIEKAAVDLVHAGEGPGVTFARTGGASRRSGWARPPGGTGRRSSSGDSQSRSPDPSFTGETATCMVSTRSASRNCRMVVTPPPSRTSLPCAASRACSRTVAGSPSTKWNVVSESVNDGRLWWVMTNTGVWNGGSSPHQPRHSWSCQGPRWGPNLLRPMISAPMLRAKSRVK